MKAIIYEKYGPPEVLRLAEVPTPQPKDHEIRVKIMATTVNRTDCGFRRVEYVAVRVVGGFFKPRNKILGSEFAGVVDQVGKGVTKFSVGDRVFGLKTFRFGTHAEYICLGENASVATMPAKVSFAEAAAVCDGLMLAHNYVGKMSIDKNFRLLVNGASGSIGSAAVQLAAGKGAQVTAVCKTAAISLVKLLGAKKVIDYTREDFAQTLKGQAFDAILDSVGKSNFFKCRHLLKPKGVYFSSELGPWWQNPLLALVTPLFGGRRVGFPLPTDNQKDMLYFKDLLEKGRYRAVIDKTWPLEKIVEATHYVERGEKIGNVVIVVASPVSKTKKTPGPKRLSRRPSPPVKRRLR